MEYRFKVYEEGKFFWAECPELPGCLTQAESMDDLRANIQEVLDLYLEERPLISARRYDIVEKKGE